MSSSKLTSRIEEAKGHVAVRWTEDRARAVERGLLRRRRQRTTARVTLAMVLVVGGLCAGGVAYRQSVPTASSGLATRTSPTVEPARAPALPPGSKPFADGSVATLLGTESELVQSESDPTLTAVKLVRGGARFRVVKNPKRLFRVEADGVTVEVLGTHFSVEYRGREVQVTVESGRVRVIARGRQTELGSGQSELFASNSSAPTALTEPPGDPETTAEMVVPRVVKARPASSAVDWKVLAEKGHFDQAYAALRKRGLTQLSGPAELLLGADVARLSHNPTDAVWPLGQVVSQFPRDPRASLAAFTLGRVLLEELGRPREAAAAFAQVSRLASDGPLNEDALARAVEAWSRAGETQRARELAEDYASRYPRGSRLRAVRRYGGLD